MSLRSKRNATPTDEPSFSESGGVRYLHFGTPWIQGAMRIRSPNTLELEYTRQMMVWLLLPGLGEGSDESDLELGLLGLGAGSMLRWLHAHTQHRIQAVEWNPKVTGACRAMFRLPPESDRMQVTHADAGEWIAEPKQRGRLHALMVDLYDAQARGPVRYSTEFYGSCREALAPGGAMTVNLFGAHESFPLNEHNLRAVFGNDLWCLPEIDAGNRIVLAWPAGVIPSRSDLLARAVSLEQRWDLPFKRWAQSLCPL